jgi:hypothetical protein
VRLRLLVFDRLRDKFESGYGQTFVVVYFNDYDKGERSKLSRSDSSYAIRLNIPEFSYKQSFSVTMMAGEEAGEAVYVQAQAPIPSRQHLPVHRFRDLVFAFAPPRPLTGCPFMSADELIWSLGWAPL